jgi:shikimate kinase
MNLILFGFKGCGKTHFGKLLAQKCGRPFIDTDDLIVRLHGKKELTVRDVYTEVGEEKFRQLECDAVRHLGHVRQSVIALGAGAILNPQSQQMLQEIGTFVYLEASLDSLLKRGVSSLVGPLKPLYQQRIALYKAIPAHTIDTDQYNETEILEKLYAL